MKRIQKIEPKKPIIKQQLKVAAYARVSVEKGRTPHSLSAQISYYSNRIQKNPEWEYAGVYSDNGLSGGSTKSRTSFQQMIEDAKEGKIDIILTKSISRFARNTVDLLETVRELKSIGVEVRFEKENIQSLSGDGELMLSILASFAQEESRSISENVKWGTIKRFKQGKPNGKFGIYGYRWEGENLVIVPEQAEIVKFIYDNFQKGLSAEKTELQLEKMGVKSYKGGHFGNAAVRAILQNITYTGNLLFQKEYTVDPMTGRSKINRGELPQYFVENHHEAIIPMEAYQAVQDERARRRKLGVFANSGVNTTCFTSKIKCAKCGMNHRRSGKRQSKKSDVVYYVWICRTKSDKGAKYCSAKIIPEKKLKEISAEALGLKEFDETVFSEKIEHILNVDDETLIFKFYDGTEKEIKWQSTAKKDYWTPERKKSWSERNKRKQSSIFNGRFNEFTGFMTCGRCGENYRLQSAVLKDGTRVKKWLCSERAEFCTKGKRNSIEEEILKQMVAEVLGIPTFDEQIMDENLERISIIDTEITFHFKDEHKEVKTYVIPYKRGTKKSEAEKQYMSKMMKKCWEVHKHGEESNNHTCNNNEV